MISGLWAITLPPVHIRIKPTNVCNHRCHFCTYRGDKLQLGDQMNPNKNCKHHCIAHNKNLQMLNYAAIDREHIDFI